MECVNWKQNLHLLAEVNNNLFIEFIWLAEQFQYQSLGYRCVRQAYIDLRASDPFSDLVSLRTARGSLQLAAKGKSTRNA